MGNLKSRDKTLLGALLFLAFASLFFYYRQNFAHQIGGRMSVAKLLWLHYTILAWFVLPFWFWRSSSIVPILRKIYGVHLVLFTIRGLVELWMIYVSISWSPVYGISHDVIVMSCITGLLWTTRKESATLIDPSNQTALWFLISIRFGLICESIFAWMFYHARGGQIALYFASSDPRFHKINLLTWAAVLLLYPDLIRVLWKSRNALFPLASERVSYV